MNKKAYWYFVILVYVCIIATAICVILAMESVSRDNKEYATNICKNLDLDLLKYNTFVSSVTSVTCYNPITKEIKVIK